MTIIEDLVYINYLIQQSLIINHKKIIKNCYLLQLDASSISIIKKFLNSELLDESEFELEQKSQYNKKPLQFNLNQMLESRRIKKCQIKQQESQENQGLNYLINELRLEQQNFQAEIDHIQCQFIQEIKFLMQKVFDQNKLFYKQQEYQLNQIQQKRLKLQVQSPQQSYSLLYQMNPNLQLYQKFNKDLKNSLVKLLQKIKTTKIYQETFNLQDQQYNSQTSRSPLAQLNKLFSRQGSIEKKQLFTNRITNTNMKLNIIMPLKRDTQSFWNQSSERKSIVQLPNLVLVLMRKEINAKFNRLYINNHQISQNLDVDVKPQFYYNLYQDKLRQIF